MQQAQQAQQLLEKHSACVCYPSAAGVASVIGAAASAGVAEVAAEAWSAGTACIAIYCIR